jgi:hypothetical protein
MNMTDNPNERSYGDMSPTNSDVLGERVRLDEGWSLGIRLDYSEHNGSDPHINLDLYNQGRIVDKDITKEILGKDNHFVPLP